MKITRILSILFTFSVIGFVGLQSGIVEKPGFGVADIGDWDNTDNSEIEIESQVWVDNQNPVGLKLEQTRLEYGLEMNKVKLAEGTKEGFNIKEGNQTVKFHTSLIQDNLQEWWVSHMKNDEKSDVEIPVKVGLTGPIPFTIGETTYTDTVETDIEASINSSASQIKGVYEGPKLLEGDSLFSEMSRPQIEVVDAGAGFGEINNSHTPLIFNLDIKNMNIYPIPEPKFEGSLDLNNVRVAEWDASSRNSGKTIDPGETEEVSFQIDIDNSKIDDWLVTHVRNQEYSTAELHLRLQFETDYGSITAPGEESLKCSFGLETAILEDNQKTGSELEGCEMPF